MWKRILEFLKYVYLVFLDRYHNMNIFYVIDIYMGHSRSKDKKKLSKDEYEKEKYQKFYDGLSDDTRKRYDDMTDEQKKIFYTLSQHKYRYKPVSWGTVNLFKM